MPSPLHPALVHLPLGLAAIVPLVLLAHFVLARRFAWPRSAFAIPLVLQAVLLGSACLALRSGEADEERVESRVPEAALHHHERWATAFTYASGGVLVLLGIAALVRAPAPARMFTALAGGASVVVLGLAVATGSAGGELVYRHGAAEAAVRPATHEHDAR